MSRRWVLAVAMTAGAYALLTAAVVAGWPLGGLDRYLAERYLVPLSSPLRWPVVLYILIGQGVPASTVAALYAIWRSRRTRSWTPVAMFTLALLMLNVSVGLMKHATGRLSPRVTDQVHTVLAGGTIYPSGHAANAVVMYGLIAMIAPAAHRRLATVLAVLVAVPVGLGTVAVDTHWITDVFGGWLGGALVLLALPAATPPVLRWASAARRPLARWYARWQRVLARPVFTPQALGAIRRTATAHPDARSLVAVTVAPAVFMPIRAGPAIPGAMARPGR